MNRSTALKIIAASFLAPYSSLSLAKKNPIKFIVGYGAGGATDLCARLYAIRLQEILGRDIIIENKPGGNTLIANRALSNSISDGNTYLIAPMSSTIFREILQPQSKRGYSMFKDYAPVGTLTTYPMGLMVPASLGVNNAKEFSQWLQKNPQEANFGTSALGSHSHLLSIMLGDILNKKITPIPYMGNNQVVTALMSNQIDAAVVSATEIVANLNNKKVRVIGTFTEKRSPLTPDVQTFSENGIPALGGEAWMGMWAKSSAPAAETQAMRDALALLSKSEKFQLELIKKLNVSEYFKSNQDMRNLEIKDYQMWEKIIKKSKLNIDA